jgi:hypothetical protein
MDVAFHKSVKRFYFDFQAKSRSYLDFPESEAFICKAFKGAAIVCYCKPLITQQMEASGLPAG